MQNPTRKILLITCFVSCCLLMHSSVFAENVHYVSVSSQSMEATQTEPPEAGCAAEYLLGQENPRLVTIRRFRDEMLSKNNTGEQLIEMYYQISESIIEMFDDNPALKRVAEKALAAVLPALEFLLQLQDNTSAEAVS